jgi:hypothetical protein
MSPWPVGRCSSWSWVTAATVMATIMATGLTRS